MSTTTAPTTPAAPAAAPTGPATPARSRINWRTVAFATAAIYAAGIPAALTLASTAADPAVTRICVHGITVLQTTEPGGRTTRTAPSGLPTCHTRKDHR